MFIMIIRNISNHIATQLLIFLQLYLLESKTIYVQLMYKCSENLKYRANRDIKQTCHKRSILDPMNRGNKIVGILRD